MTIIVLIILSGVTILSIINADGMYRTIKKAQEDTQIGQEKEWITLSITSVIVNGRNVDSLNLQEELDNFAGKNKTEVKGEYDILEVEFTDSKRVYKVDKFGNIDIIKDYDSTPGILDGKGTEENPFKIESIEDLLTFKIMLDGGNSELGIESSNFQDKYLTITRELDFNDNKSYCDPYTNKYSELLGNKNINLKELITSKEYGFYKNSSISEFNGVLNGEGNSIKNIILFAENDRKVLSLFSINNGTIKNLNIDGEYNSEYNILSAGLVAENYGNISNCNNKVNINAISYVGGITSKNYGAIENSKNYGNLKLGGNDAGGIVNRNSSSGVIRYCANYGNIEGENVGLEFGGISAYNEGIIEQCYNKGNILDHYQLIGGISGVNENIIENCYNIGNLSGSWNIGGICGRVSQNCKIKNCYNAGTINSKSSYGTGGLIGELVVSKEIYNLFCLEGMYSKLSTTSLNDTCMFKNEKELKSYNIIDLLNEGNISNLWEADKDNINKGYPILSWKND